MTVDVGSTAARPAKPRSAPAATTSHSRRLVAGSEGESSDASSYAKASEDTPSSTDFARLTGVSHPKLEERRVAEREGFEPSVLSPVQRFSRPPRSTTPAPLRWLAR